MATQPSRLDLVSQRNRDAASCLNVVSCVHRDQKFYFYLFLRKSLKGYPKSSRKCIMVPLNSSWVLKERDLVQDMQMEAANETCLILHVSGTSQHRHLLI